MISPRLAIRILWKGGFSTSADAAAVAAAAAAVDVDVDENVRFETIEEMLLRAARPSQAARSNNSLEEDIFVDVYCSSRVNEHTNLCD